MKTVQLRDVERAIFRMSNIPDGEKIYKLDEVEDQDEKIMIDPYDGCIYINED